MYEVAYDASGSIDPQELGEFYGRLQHETAATDKQLSRMVERSAVFVTARVDERLVGIARGVTDGMRGYLSECKLDPVYQGPAAVTRRDGRIEHDSYGIAAEMARRVLEKFQDEGLERVDVLAWGTEVDFLEELGFKRSGGLIALTLRVAEAAHKTAPTTA